MFGYIFLFMIGCSIGMSARLYASDILPEGGILYQEDFLRSTNEAYYALMQRDGNFVVYTSPDFSPVNAQWSSNSTEKGQPPYRLVLQDNGNLIIFDANNVKTWSTRTAEVGERPYHLIMQIDRNLVLYDCNQRAIWASNTAKW